MNDDMTRKVAEIASATSVQIDERIATLSDMLGDNEGTPEKDAVIYRAIIDMIREENALATHVSDLMHLYVLLAEACCDMEDYRPLDRIAFDVREVLRDNRIAWDVIADTLPRLIDAMSDSVYHHETYRLLLVYLRAAYDAGELTVEMKDQARQLLKLQILLDDTRWGGYLMDKEFEKAVAGLFEPYELVRIILNPAVGRLKADPVEYTSRWEEIYYDVEERLQDRFANAPRQRGFCFLYWRAKQELLKEEYGIDWRNPSQMNPRVKFD